MPTHHQDTPLAQRHVWSERLALAIGFMLAVSALVFFAWLAGEMLEGDTAHFDAFVRSAVHAYTSDNLTALMKFVTLLGSSLVLVPVSVLAIGIFFARREYHVVRLLVASFAGGLALEIVLKLAFHRARPVPFFNLPAPSSYSFPSGHALVSLCVYSALAMIFAARVSSIAAKIAIWTLAGLLIFAIGFSRVYLGVHYPSDVVAGYAAGIVWLSSVSFVDNLHFQHIQRERRLNQHA
jgi:membrane-associated phospholipid phosphatase